MRKKPTKANKRIYCPTSSSSDVSKMVRTKIAKLHDKPAETLALSSSDESTENEESSSRRQTHDNNSQRKSDNLSKSSKKCDHLFDSNFEESKPDSDLENDLRSLRNQLRNKDTVMAEKNAMIAEKQKVLLLAFGCTYSSERSLNDGKYFFWKLNNLLVLASLN